LKNPFFAFDTLILRDLNQWAARKIFLITVLSEYLVFAVIALALLWLVKRTYQQNRPQIEFKLFLKNLCIQGVTILAIPVGVATAVSEVISRVYARERPFIAMHDIRLLVPHSADGGMPSHHVVFMASTAFMVYLLNKRLGIVLIVLSLISGVGRISAGIHYPSDVLVAFLLAGITIYLYSQLISRFRWEISNL